MDKLFTEERQVEYGIAIGKVGMEPRSNLSFVVIVLRKPEKDCFGRLEL
jgi:hypothetical protein